MKSATLLYFVMLNMVRVLRKVAPLFMGVLLNKTLVENCEK
jgi:hypothetical protein